MKFNVSISEVLKTKTKQKIVKFLLNHNALMSEREIASVLKVSHMSVNRTMRDLKALNFIDMVAAGNSYLWRVNRKSYSYGVLFEMVKNISRIRTPMDDLKLLLLKNLRSIAVKKAVLFGSVAKKKETPDSDIDIFILISNKQSRKKLGLILDKLSKACLDKYGNRLSPYILTKSEMNNKKNLKIIEEVSKGIQIIPEQNKL